VVAEREAKHGAVTSAELRTAERRHQRRRDK